MIEFISDVVILSRNSINVCALIYIDFPLIKLSINLPLVPSLEICVVENSLLSVCVCVFTGHQSI